MKWLADALPDYHWLVLSDDAALQDELRAFLSPRTSLVVVPEASHEREVALYDFFSLSRASLIVASSLGLGPANGWSSFWYVAAQLARAPLLALVEENTRLDLIRSYVRGQLSNVTTLVEGKRRREKMQFELRSATRVRGFTEGTYVKGAQQTWTFMKSQNLELPKVQSSARAHGGFIKFETASSRCAHLRFSTLEEAQAHCTLHDWCGGIVIDAGLECVVHDAASTRKRAKWENGTATRSRLQGQKAHARFASVEEAVAALASSMRAEYHAAAPG